MHRKNITANFDIYQIFIDCILILLAYFISHQLYMAFRGTYLDISHLWIYIIYNVIFVLCMFLFRMYNITTFYYIDRVIKYTLISTIIAGLCICAVIFLTEQKTTSRLFFALFATMSFLFTLLFRVIIHWLHKEHIGNGYTHVLFVGDEKTCEQYQRYIEKTSIKVKVDLRVDFSDPLLKTSAGFESLLVDMLVNEVVIVHGVKENLEIDPLLLLKVCEDMGTTSRLLLDLYNLPESKRFVSSIGTYPMLTYHNTSFDKVQIFFKTMLDVFGALIGLLVFAPVLVVTAIAIKIESPGPIFFKQIRVGQNGKCFKMYKFRSMYEDAEERRYALMSQNKIKDGMMFKMDNDPRITKVGEIIRKTSIDELPQLLNVLKREMSLVGTRPPTVDEVEKYERRHRRRISIRPGITGMWQVNGRSNILDFEEVVALDKQYIDQWSLGLDIMLIFKTVTAVVSHRGAS